MKAANPYLNFNGNTEEAFKFYRSVFGGEFLALLRMRDFDSTPEGLSEAERDRVAHVALPLGDTNILMGTDILESQGQRLQFGNNYYIALEAESAEEARRVFDGLSAGGTVEMPLGRTEWAELYGSCVDRFSVQWMVSYTGSVTLQPDSAG